MTQQFQNGANYVVVLNRGDELIASLTAFAKHNSLESLWLQSGLGASMNATIGRYDLEAREYVWSQFDDLHEIVQLSGNMVLVSGEPTWHIHATLGAKDLSAVAGHIKSLTVGLTCEMLITVLETPLTRTHDDTTGLNLLGN